MVEDKYRYVGKKIKNLRQKHNLTLKELSEKTDLSVSFLSQLENGKIVPSLTALDKIASFFSIHIANLFVKKEIKSTRHYDRNEHLTVSNKGKILQFLMPKIEEMEIVRLTLKEDASNYEYTTHKGIEFVYVYRGEVIIDFEDSEESYVCKEGDTIIYDARKSHKIINNGNEVVECFVVNLPQVDKINAR